MRNRGLCTLGAVAALVGSVALAPAASAAHGALTITGLTANDRLVTFKASDPTTVLTTTRVTGLAEGDDLVAIDFRPRTGALYGVAVSDAGVGTVYTIAPSSGVATAVAGAPALPLSGDVSIDVNPVADALRVVDSEGSNLRLRFADLVLFTDKDLTYEGATPAVGDVAYTNSIAAPATTQLFDLDAATDTLALQSPPNDGVLVRRGTLGQPTKAQATGFDIYTRTTDGVNWAFVSLFDKGRATFYEIDLSTGKPITVTTPVPGSGKQIATTPHVVDIALAPAQTGF